MSTRAPKPQYNRPTADWHRMHTTLTTEEVCGLLLVSADTATRLLKDGHLRGKQSGKGYVFDRDSVRAYVTGAPAPFEHIDAMQAADALYHYGEAMMRLCSELKQAAGA